MEEVEGTHLSERKPQRLLAIIGIIPEATVEFQLIAF